MTTITIAREIPEQLLSDILITAFDGAYGWSWNWFEPVGPEWLKTKDGDDDIWLSARVRLKKDCQTGSNIFDDPTGFVVDHDVIAQGMSRIINDDYVGVWRTATSVEYESWKAMQDDPTRNFYREWKLEGTALKICTGETARGYRTEIRTAADTPEDADIDAPMADCIVQTGVFGKVIFS